MSRKFRSRIFFRVGSRLANAGSLLSIILLAATFGTQLEIQASGEDEEAAIQATEAFFRTDEELAVKDAPAPEVQAEPPAKSS